MDNLPLDDLFEGYYDKHFGICVYHANKIVRNPVLAKELTQNAFIKVFQALRERLSYTEIDEARGLLIVATRNLAFDWKRHNKVERSYERDTVYVQEQPEKVSANEEKLEARLAVHEALNRLSRQDSQIAWLVLAMGFTVMETATELDIDRRVVRRRLEYPIIPFLRAVLKPYKDY